MTTPAQSAREMLAAQAEPKTDAEKLAELERDLRSWGIIELAVRNPNVASHIEHWEGRALKAEAELSRLQGVIATMGEALDEANKTLEAAAYKMIVDEYGFVLASEVEGLGWRWPDTAPRVVNATLFTTLESIRRARTARRAG